MRTQAAAALGVVLAEDADVVSDVLRGLLEQHDRLAKRLHEFGDWAVGAVGTRCQDAQSVAVPLAKKRRRCELARRQSLQHHRVAVPGQAGAQPVEQIRNVRVDQVQPGVLHDQHADRHPPVGPQRSRSDVRTIVGAPDGPQHLVAGFAVVALAAPIDDVRHRHRRHAGKGCNILERRAAPRRRRLRPIPTLHWECPSPA